MKAIPPNVQQAAKTSPELPLLPKKAAHLYPVDFFVTRCKMAWDDIDSLLKGEDAFRVSALRCAENSVVVFETGQRPWIFYRSVQAAPLGIPESLRISAIHLTPKDAEAGEAPAFLRTPRERWVLQGTLHDLEACADNVVVRYEIGRRGDDVRWYEAFGTPKASVDWRSRIAGCRESLLTSVANASRRATLKFVFDNSKGFEERFNTFGAIAFEHGVEWVMNGAFEARVVTASPITFEQKQKLAGHAGVRVVFTDVMVKPPAPKVGATDPIDAVASAASQVTAEEAPVFLETTACLSTVEWDEVCARMGARLLVASACNCAVAVPRQRLREFEGTRWWRLIGASSTPPV